MAFSPALAYVRAPADLNVSNIIPIRLSFEWSDSIYCVSAYGGNPVVLHFYNDGRLILSYSGTISHFAQDYFVNKGGYPPLPDGDYDMIAFSCDQIYDDDEIIAEYNNGNPVLRIGGSGSPGTTSKEPVIIVPGILGSRLNRVSDGEEVWLNSFELIKPGPDLYLNQLKLDKFGNEIIDINSTLILEREFLVFPFYENLIDKFESNGYIRGGDVVIFDYDRRKSISLLSLELKQVIDNKASFSPTGKVSIVAHSMGGVLTKEYLRQNEGDSSKINNIVIAGAPQLGAVKAFNLLNFRDNLNVPILNPDTAKDISQNMPSVYQLLPSQEYINQSGGYIEDYRGGQYKVLNYDETKNFMVNDSRNESLLSLAESFHRDLDNFKIDGPKITNLVGCNTKTLVGVKLFDNKKADVVLTGGDGTVPFVSARQMFSNLNQSNYYAVRGFDHFGLVSRDQALNFISASIIGNIIPSLSDIKSDDSFCYFDARRFFLFSTHSPVNLKVYDEQGNYIGLNEDGDVNIGIPDGDFIRIGENNFVLVPEGQGYRAIIDAYDTGSFDFKIRILSDDRRENSALYLDIPINQAGLNAEVFFNGELSDSLLSIDEDGNGEIDKLLAPNFIILRLDPVTIEDIITNVGGAYELGWMEDEARKYLIKRLEHINKLEFKDESKDDEIREVLSSLLIKLDHYLGGGLISSRAYDIIKEDINLVNY